MIMSVTAGTNANQLLASLKKTGTVPAAPPLGAIPAPDWPVPGNQYFDWLHHHPGSGDDPLAVYAGLIQQAFFTPLGLMIAIQRATSLILTSLAGFVPAFFKVVSGVSEVITGVIANQIMPSLLGIFLGLLFLRVASRGREI
jgi:hypothetical protein